MEYLYVIILFMFGATIGSFVNVISDRFNTGLSFLKGRSFCFSCNTELTKVDLFPIFSFLFLKGKCRYCKSKIPNTALVVEILMGILSVIAAFKSGFLESLELGAWSLELGLGYLVLTAIFAVILLISVYDLRHFIIPDAFLVSFFLLALSSKLLALSLFNIAFDLFAGVVLSLPFLLIFVFSKGRWIGFGDVKYILCIGIFLGFPVGLSAVILSFWVGAILSLLALFFKRFKSHFGLLSLFKNLTIKSEIPFGPFLSLGILISFYFSADIFQVNYLFNSWFLN